MLMGALVKSNYFVFNMSTRLAIHTITLKKKKKKPHPTPPKKRIMCSKMHIVLVMK